VFVPIISLALHFILSKAISAHMPNFDF
jgi:hypothetical protein